MDLVYHIGLILLIGIFFFLDKKSKSSDSLMFVLIFAFMGLFFLMNFNVEFINYAVYDISTHSFQSTNLTGSNLGGVTFQSFLVIIYVWFIFLGAVGFTTGNNNIKNE